jgi:colicin import membrane protein
MIRRHENPVAIRAGAMSLLVHVVLLSLLLVSFNWKSVKPISVAEVELWDTVPAAKPEPVPPPPAPEPEPEPPKPEPVIKEEPKPEPPPEPNVDIEVKKKVEPPKKETPKKVEPKKDEKPKPDPKIELEKKRRLEEEKLKKLQQELLAEDSKAMQQDARKDAPVGPKSEMSAASAGEVETYMAKISSKIRQNVNKQLCGTGKPELTVAIALMPTGEVIGSPRLLKSSGMPACDEAVERAILQSQPLPVPTQPDLFSRFRDLNLKFRPNGDN